MWVGKRCGLDGERTNLWRGPNSGRCLFQVLVTNRILREGLMLKTLVGERDGGTETFVTRKTDLKGRKYRQESV